MEKLVNWLETHQLPCAWKENLGFDCPGCGLQSAIIELLKGHLAESIRLYPALIPMLLMILVLILHLIFKLPDGARLLKILFIFTVSILLAGYFLKLFT